MVQKNKKPVYGRPKKPLEIKLTKKCTISFTENEYNNITEKAGRVPLAVYIKDFLADNKFFK